MKHPARGAGSARRSRSRAARPLVAAALSFALVTGAALAADQTEREVRGAARASQALLIPWQTIPGARLATRVDPTGQILPGTARAFTRFLYPTAVAARGPDIYVADSGANALYRLDAALQMMNRVPGVSVLPGTRVRVGPDQTLFVLDPGAGRIRRFSRDGSLLQTISDGVSTTRFSDMAMDDAGRRLYAVDALTRRILAFHPAGGAASVVAAPVETGGALQGFGAIAAEVGGVFAVDMGCRCIVRLSDNGGVTARFGEGELKQPGAIAVARGGWVFAVDMFDNSVKAFEAGRLLASITAGQLGVTGISGLAADEGFLYIADGTGAKVVVMRVASGSRER